jgi:flagellar biosynthesis anti-sigma factor FlgM
MRIDLTNTAASQIADDKTPKQVNAQDIPSSELAGNQDRTTLTSARQSHSGLVQSAMASPEVRHELVNNLKQAIQSGKYELHPGKIAQSMVDEQS